MRDAAHAKWIAGFDMEDLISTILRSGIVLSSGLILAGLILTWSGTGHVSAEHHLYGTNLLQFVLADFRRIGTPSVWSSVLIHVGLVVLLLTPYLRVAASVLYFATVARSWKRALLSGLVFATLTYLLFLG